jgi:peroxiredoxin
MRMLTVWFICLLLARAGAAEGVVPGDQVPDLAVTTLSGERTSLHALRGERPLVLIVWCSTCHSCRAIEDGFDRFALAYGDRAAVYALASNPRETADAVRDRQRQSHLSFPVVIDPDGAAAAFFHVTATTTALVIAADGTLAYRGQFADKDQPFAQAALDALLAGGRPEQGERPQWGCPVR